MNQSTKYARSRLRRFYGRSVRTFAFDAKRAHRRAVRAGVYGR